MAHDRNHFQCPTCGNTDISYMQDNGFSPNALQYRLICTRPRQGTDKPGPDGACGRQWEPNMLPRPITNLEPTTPPPAEIDAKQAWLDAFIVRSGFRHGWEHLESWARTVAEQAYEEHIRGPFVATPAAADPQPVEVQAGEAVTAEDLISELVKALQASADQQHIPGPHDDLIDKALGYLKLMRI